ncbi:MAG: DUF4300 family protein [Oscillospiraceae bacterium]
MKKNRRYKLAVLLIGGMVLLSGCSSADPNESVVKPDDSTTGVYTNLVADKEKNELKEIMKDASLSNTDIFFKWAEDYNSSMDKSSGLVQGWSPISESSYKEDVLSASWDNTHVGETDANCRLTAFLLMQNLIKSNPMSDYGTYLMMDVDEIEKNDRYSTIKENEGNYIALFNQVSVADAKADSDYLSAFTEAWSERGVVFPTGKVSLVSVIMNDSFDKVLFIGHTGILIEEDGYLLFIEKLAPTMPYQVTRYADRKQMSETLLARPEYTLGDEDFGTFLMENDKVL